YVFCMLNKQISDLFDMHVYSEKAVYLGKVEDVVLDVSNKKISGLALSDVNTKVIDTKNFSGIILPYRIVKDVGDIIIVRHLPQIFKDEMTLEE
ncbi:MAG TPA: PRC-barrel domain-containing protein, partial [Methanocorpusculum sp.]|nr:PRC-barrel domain-containing protein [Methanocorpusculum sp.]